MNNVRINFLIIGFLLAACTPASAPALESTAQVFVSPAATQPACRAAPTEPTALPGVDSLFPAVQPDEWSRGPSDAAVTIVEYNDYQCLECNDSVLSKLAREYPDEVRLVYRPYPQPAIYDKALLAAQAAEAAGAQNQYWKMHDLLFAKQSQWVFLPPDDFSVWVTREAVGLGLERAQFESDFISEETAAKVQADVDAGNKTGTRVLPLVLINGEIYFSPTDYSAFDQVVRLTALGKRQFTTCPEMLIDPTKQYFATLNTNRGDIVIELYADKAPLTVNSFIFLARNGWYAGNTFFQIIPGLLAQTGDPSETGIGGPGYLFRDEINASLQFDRPGMVAMANSGADTNGSRFFITFAAASQLDGIYSIFGHVLSGMDVLAKIAPRDPSQDVGLGTGDLILSITIEER